MSLCSLSPLHSLIHPIYNPYGKDTELARSLYADRDCGGLAETVVDLGETDPSLHHRGGEHGCVRQLLPCPTFNAGIGLFFKASGG